MGKKPDEVKTTCPVCGGYMAYVGQGDTRVCIRCGYKGHGK